LKEFRCRKERAGKKGTYKIYALDLSVFVTVSLQTKSGFAKWRAVYTHDGDASRLLSWHKIQVLSIGSFRA
jgi:hypothetical protein